MLCLFIDYHRDFFYVILRGYFPSAQHIIFLLIMSSLLLFYLPMNVFICLFIIYNHDVCLFSLFLSVGFCR